MNKQIISECKEYIDANKHEELQEFFAELMSSDFDERPDWPTIFQAVYIHACLKKRAQTAAWLQTLFTQFDPAVQIAYRQVFVYGNWLLAK